MPTWKAMTHAKKQQSTPQLVKDNTLTWISKPQPSTNAQRLAQQLLLRRCYDAWGSCQLSIVAICLHGITCVARLCTGAQRSTQNVARLLTAVTHKSADTGVTLCLENNLCSISCATALHHQHKQDPHVHTICLVKLRNQRQGTMPVKH
jgi:hypothetical protein